MPNAFAYLAMVCWPLVALIIKSKFTKARAAAIAVIGPYLFLPENTIIDLPGVPPIDKHVMIALVGFAVFVMRNKQFVKLPQETGTKLLFIIMFFLPLGVIATNQDPLHYGPETRPALPWTDFIDLNFHFFYAIYAPFMIGYVIFKSKEDHLELLRVMVTFGLVYSLLMLYEVRMSPQLHIKFYGFFPHQFTQMIRGDGFRPLVFLGHGLLVALFTSYLVIAVCYFYKNKIPYISKYPGYTCIYLIVVAILCKTFAAMIYLVIFIPLIFFLGVKKQLKACALVALFVFIFPLLRVNDLIPMMEFYDLAYQISPDRAGSFKFRLDHEEALIEKANERPILGWGGWGRSLIYHPVTGKSLSIVDGFWIIVYGTMGFIGHIVYFGVYCWPVILLYRMSRKQGEEEDYKITACLAMMLCVVLLDSIPNAGRSTLTTLMAGAIIGRIVEMRSNFSQKGRKSLRQ